MNTKKDREVIIAWIAAIIGVLIGLALSTAIPCSAQDLCIKGAESQAGHLDWQEIKSHPNGPTVHVKLYDDQERASLWVLPVPHRTADKAFWITTAISVASTVADMENTRLVLNTGGRELNPLYGAHPDRLRQYSVSGALFALATYVSYRAKRRQDAEIAFGVRPEHPKWIVSQLANIGTHAFGIAFTIGSTGK